MWRWRGRGKTIPSPFLSHFSLLWSVNDDTVKVCTVKVVQ